METKPIYDKSVGTHWQLWDGDICIATVYHGEYLDRIERALDDSKHQHSTRQLARTLRAMRKNANLALIDVKNITDIPVVTLSDFERGVSVPSDEGLNVLIYTYRKQEV